MVNAWIGCLLTSLGGVLLALPASTQERSIVDGKKRVAAEKRARRLVTFLELPDRRSEAIDKLLRMGPAAVPALTEKLGDPRPAIVIPCMHILRELGEHARPSLAKMTALQESDDKAIARCASWARSRLVFTGRLLVASHHRGKLFTIDAKLRQRQALDMDVLGLMDMVDRPDPNAILGPIQATKLANGNLLVTEHYGKRVSEFGPDGTRIWSYKKLGWPTDADRLPNGNTLICDAIRKGKPGRVIEVSRKGNVVWEWTERGCEPLDADRLPNGNTLIAESSFGKVIEVDPSGKVVWRVDLTNASTAQRLDDGNTLASSRGGVFEFNPAGKVVFELLGLDWPKDARRLPDGSTLVADKKGLHAFDEKGKKIRTLVTGEVTRFSRY